LNGIRDNIIYSTYEEIDSEHIPGVVETGKVPELTTGKVPGVETGYNIINNVYYDDNPYFKNKDSIKPYHDPKRVDFNINLLSGGGQESWQSTKTINSFGLNKDVNNINLSNDTLKIKFTDNNKKTDDGLTYYFAKGASTGVYTIKFTKSKEFPLYNDKECIMRLFKSTSIESGNKSLETNITKYKEDLLLSEETKKYFIDILYYGLITKNGDYFIYYIVPKYDTEPLLINFLSLNEKKQVILNTIKMIKLFNLKNKYIADLKVTNISISDKLEPVIIDYDNMSILDNSTDINYKIYEYIHSYYSDPINSKKLDKIYQVLLIQLIYQFFFLGKIENIGEIKIKFDELFSKIVLSKKKIMNDPETIKHLLEPLYEKTNYFGLDSLLYKNNKGLLANNYNDILSLDDIEGYVKVIFDKPTTSWSYNNKTIEKIKPYLSDTFFMNKYGCGIVDYINPNLDKFQFISMKMYEKPRSIHYYLRTNNWNIKYYNTADEVKNNNTLKYALQSVGCIHSVKLNGINYPPTYTLYFNNDFKNKYGYYFDNCRVLEDPIWIYLFWMIEITNLFNIFSSKYDLNKTFYINIHDHPIVRKTMDIINDDPSKHPFPDIKLHLKKQKKLLIPVTVLPDEPIYCCGSNKNYNDIPLAFPDMWMFLFGYDFSKNFNIDNYIPVQDFNNKIPKAIFRGSYTNCSYPIKDSVRMISHIKTLQDRDNIIDSYIVGSEISYKYQHFDHTLLKIEGIDFFMKPDKFMKETDQLKYKYILNLDGFASAYRIIKEMYYDSIIIIPESNFTDIIRNILEPWKHYIPCNKDLSNLKNTIKWCEANQDKMLIIIKNLMELRDGIISIDNMLSYTFNKLTTNNKNLVEICNFDTSKQPLIEHPLDFGKEQTTLLGKVGKVKISDLKGNIQYKEDIHYNKYFKYKSKYLQLKNNLS
jgi:hypothetical protein